jgi:Na+/melibiose symporter-like transporter
VALTESQINAIKHPIKWFLEPTPPGGLNPDGSIPRNELTSLSLGIMGQNHLYNMAGTERFFNFLTNVLHIDPGIAGTMGGAITTFDAINDPIAGSLIDRHRFKNGQKLVPWIKTAPIIAVLALLLFVNWGFESQSAKILYSIIVYVLWDCLYSFQDAAQWGLTAIISPDSRQRARATQWADIGAFLGGLLPGLLLGVLSGDGKGNFLMGMSQAQIYFAAAALFCLSGGAQMLLATRVKERVPAPPPQEDFFKNISVLRHNYVLIAFVICDVLNVLTPRISDLYMYQQQTYTVFGKEITAAWLVIILSTFTGLPGTAAKFFTTKLSDKVGGMKNILIISRIVSIATRVVAYFIGINSFPAFVIMYSLQIIDFLPNGMWGIAMRTMIADSVDYVEWKTGQRTEGITMSMYNFKSKITGAIDRFMLGRSLKWLEYDSHKIDAGQKQNDHFNKFAWPVYKLGPVIGLVLSLIPLFWLKYPDELKQRVTADLAERRAARALEEQEESMADNE